MLIGDPLSGGSSAKWILESAHCFSVCTYIYLIFTFYVGELDAQKGAVCS